MNGKLMMYLDQYGRPYWARTLKELREKVSGACTKMYVDKKAGGTVHCGYVIGDLWLTAYIPYEVPA